VGRPVGIALAAGGAVLAVSGLAAAIALAGPLPDAYRDLPGSASGHGSTPAGADPDAPSTWDDPDWGLSELYGVQDDGTLWPAPPGPVQRVWSTFEQIVTPAYAIATIDTLQVADAENSDLLAYVWRQDDGEHFGLAVNLADSGDESYLAGTLIHEYGHLLSLGPDQMGPRPAHCETFFYGGKCARQDAYLAGFQRAFWDGYDDAPGVDNDDEDVTADFYDAHEGDFVDEYAATSLLEDFAETFMIWVLESHPEDAPAGPIADKLAYFDGLPAFVAIRDRIRGEMGPQLGDGGWPGFGG